MTEDELIEKVADYFSRKRYTTLEKARGTIGEYSDYNDARQILVLVKAAGYLSPKEIEQLDILRR